MKKLILPVLGLAAILGAGSCSEDFSVAAPYKNITVMNGILTSGSVDDISDTAQYIRIQKAFLDESKSAIDMAKVSDSSFYPESALNVSIREYSGSNLVSSTTLPRVDLNQEGYTKMNGVFFTGPNYAYKYKHSLNSNYTYRLVIKNNQTGEVDSASSVVVPAGYTVSTFSTLFSTIEFVNPQVTDFDYAWTVQNPPNVSYYQAIIRFNWVDKNAVTGETTTHYADWNFASSSVKPNTSALVMTVGNRGFFSALNSLMGTPGDNIERYLGTCDFYLWAGDTTMYNYMLFSQAQGGITGDQVKPNYSNVHSSVPGTYPVGIFGSRAVASFKGALIGDKSLDSLMTEPITAKLRIRGRA